MRSPFAINEASRLYFIFLRHDLVNVWFYKMVAQKKKENEGFFKCFVEKDLLAYKAFSFFIYGGFGALYPFLPLYFKSYGLSSLLAGTIVGIRPLIQFVGAPFWTELAERFQVKKLFLCGGILAWIVKALLLWAVIPKHQLCIQTYTNSSTNISYISSRDFVAEKRLLKRLNFNGKSTSIK